MSVFVGVSKGLLTESELKALLTQLQGESSYYCLRWTHKLSDFERNLPDEFPSPEGQLFDENREIRWQQKGDGFSVLLLSIAGSHPDFREIGSSWAVQNRDAHLYPPTETRFPKSTAKNAPNIAQRYFLDADTSTVHFVALTVKQQ